MALTGAYVESSLPIFFDSTLCALQDRSLRNDVPVAANLLSHTCQQDGVAVVEDQIATSSGMVLSLLISSDLSAPLCVYNKDKSDTPKFGGCTTKYQTLVECSGMRSEEDTSSAVT